MSWISLCIRYFWVDHCTCCYQFLFQYCWHTVLHNICLINPMFTIWKICSLLLHSWSNILIFSNLKKYKRNLWKPSTYKSYYQLQSIMAISVLKKKVFLLNSKITKTFKIILDSASLCIHSIHLKNVYSCAKNASAYMYSKNGHSHILYIHGVPFET